MRNPIGVLIERSARKRDRRWRWHRGAMEWWDGMDLVYCPFRCSVYRWRHDDWLP